MRVLVCGGRDFNDNALVFRTLDRIQRRFGIECIIHGGASGADSYANVWAYGQHVDVFVFKADWKAHGRSAGPIRNERMLLDSKPDVVVAFPGGRGTKDMVTRAYKAGVAAVEVNECGETSFRCHATRALIVARKVSDAILKPTTAERGAKLHTMKEE
jgi:hypothetical protein